MSKVLFFHHYNDFSGSTRVLANILLEEYSNEKDLCVFMDNSKEGCLSNIEGLRIVHIPIFRVKGKAIPIISQLCWIVYGFIRAIFIGHKFDVFYINTIIPVYGALAGRFLKKKVKYHIHEKYVQKSPKVLLAEYVFNHTKSERVFVSEYLKNQYKDKSNCTTCVVYNKLSTNFISRVNVKPVAEHSKKNLLMISSLSEGKGAYVIRELANVLPDLNFRVIYNTTKEEIVNFYKDDIPSNLEVIPKQEDIHPYLFDADVVLNLSQPFLWVETFGMTLIEAMAYGLPTIAPNVGGPVEIVKNGINGYCVDVSNINEIVTAINNCLDKDNYEYLNKGALKRIKLFRY